MEEKVNIQPDEGCGGCSGCGSGGGCSKAGGCGSCGGCDIRSKLHSFNYFEDIPGGYADDDMVEVQFKNTRKGFYVATAPACPSKSAIWWLWRRLPATI